METELPVMGMVKLVIKNESGKKVKVMAYVVEGAKESLLGHKDGKKLGIIHINSKGSGPRMMSNLEETEKEQYTVVRLEILHKREEPVPKLKFKQQEELEVEMSKLVDKYPQVF